MLYNSLHTFFNCGNSINSLLLIVFLKLQKKNHKRNLPKASNLNK